MRERASDDVTSPRKQGAVRGVGGGDLLQEDMVEE
jgi:hypothetical protein